ncbi:MAG: GIY-YIG nuclease family protein, partial [Thermoanaerobaculia bacterium]
MREYYVYLLTNDWRNVLYTGVSNSLERRNWEHKNKVHHGFTASYNCDILVYYEVFDDIWQVIAREK